MALNQIEIALDETLERFVEREVAEGRFRSIAEVIEAALQMFEQRESRLAALRAIMTQTERLPRPDKSAAPARARRGDSAAP